MSLAIEVDNVKSVLLADGWHEVAPNSFQIDAYEFRDGDEVLLKGGAANGVISTGATWKGTGGESIACPLTSILAIKY
jgi:hypothetical protein